MFQLVPTFYANPEALYDSGWKCIQDEHTADAHSADAEVDKHMQQKHLGHVKK